MALTWTNLFFAAIPVLMAVGSAIIKAYVDNQVQNLRMDNLENRLEHVAKNMKQRDEILFKELKEVREELKNLSIQLANIGK
jgi:hypothetical protein